MIRKWDKYDLAGALIAGMNVIIGAVIYFILDGDIAIQWRGAVPTSIVSKNYIFLFPLIAVLFLFFGKGFLRYFTCKWFENTDRVLINYANMFLQVMCITCQLYTVLYAYGLRITVAGILIAEIIIGYICGKKLIR